MAALFWELWVFGLFERVYSSVKAIGTETEIKGYKKTVYPGG